ncbi:hypothetical protein AVEN_132701-1 [Araneus ventricosus]|uniref:Uncharacterized protein n=1 Tax=Araneus ventricosus TaxID=182803 RepID=A0A4Y2AVT4_ARAVE|nr:hypothetical protein AVEN_132701-1 [Araneus ventricosus]
MKPFDFKYGRKTETNDEKEENVILMEESVDEDFRSFKQEIEAAGMKYVIYLESSMIDFPTNLFVFIYNIGGARMNADSRCACLKSAGFKKFTVVIMTGLRAINLAKSKFV